MGMTQNRTTIQILKSITLPLFAKLRSVKWHFLSFVFKFFVPSLFLSLISSNKPYCISVRYIKSVVYQEEHYDSSEKAKNQQQEVCTIMKEAKK